MKVRRKSKLIVDSPSAATGDIAFNLIIFFLVCASVQPDSGRQQTLPRSEEIDETQQKVEHVEVLLTRTTAMINGDAVLEQDFLPRLRRLLAGKVRQEDKVVVVKSKPETPYNHWIRFTGLIEKAGGIITIQTEEEREIQLPG